MIILENKDIEMMNERIKKVDLSIKSIFNMIIIFIISSIVISLSSAMHFIPIKPLSPSIFLSVMAILLTCYIYLLNTYFRLQDNLSNKISNRERHIKDSIDMFYIPLQNFLMIYEENASDKVKLKMINEINAHKNMAEPRVQALFETYLLKEDNSKRVSRKLLDLVCIDIEYLQNSLVYENKL